MYFGETVDKNVFLILVSMYLFLVYKILIDFCVDPVYYDFDELTSFKRFLVSFFLMISMSFIYLFFLGLLCCLKIAELF